MAITLRAKAFAFVERGWRVIICDQLKPKQQQTKLATHDDVAPKARRRWLFRFMALLVPIVFLLICELLLRPFGYGYSPHFFLPATVNGERAFIENQQFSRRYFPPALARTPQPVLFSATKRADTCRIFVLGESAAMGDPEPAFGMPRALQVLLEERNPGQHFEVINVAVTAINSHVIREIARDCVWKGGDIWIIYMGNNEVVGPHGAGTVFGSQAPSLGFIRATIALKATRLGQLFEAIRLRLLPKNAHRTSWEGMEMFVKQQVRQSDPRMATVYSHFGRNLADIVNFGERSGARILLSTVASNLKDCPPFASLHRAGLAEAKRKEWEEHYFAGIEAETKTNFALALDAFQKAAAIDSEYGELQYRMAHCSLALANLNRARDGYSAARESDALRFRADSRENEIIRVLASNHTNSGFAFVDAVELFATNSSQQIPGAELLLDHVHFTFEGTYLLARALAERIQNMVGPANLKSGQGAWLSSAECADRLALTDWDRLQLAEEMIGRLRQPPFTQQIGNAQRLAEWEKLRARLRPAAQGDALNSVIANYRRAIARRPEDWVLHENFAKLLQSSGEPVDAEKEWRKVLELLPHSEEALYSLGNVLDAQGKSAEALNYLRQALRRRPNSFEARNGMGLALSSQGKTDEAIQNYREALRHKPDFIEAQINLGQALAQKGRDDEAIETYRAALRSNSNSVPAHINLGRALAKRNHLSEARAEYEAALALEPDNAIAHYNLGNLLVGQGDSAALRHFEAAVGANPQFLEARYNLGLGFAAQNRTTDAIAQFKEVIRLRPDFSDAHLNLGVALAKERRYEEAAAEFNAVLRLEPGNGAAKKYLDQAVELQRRGAP